MKKILIISITLLCIYSCPKDKSATSAAINVNYPAAYVVNAKDNSISVINLNDNAVSGTIALPNASFPYHIYISTNKKLLAVSVTNTDMSAGFPANGYNKLNTGNKVLIIDAINGKTLNEIPLKQLVSNAIFSPADSTELWIGQADDVHSKILIYNIADWSLKNTITSGKGLAEITFCSDHDMAFACTTGEDSVQMYNSVTKSFFMNARLSQNPTGAWPSNYHSNFITCEGNNRVYELNATNCLTIDSMFLSFKPSHIIYSASKYEMWMSDVTNNQVVWFTKNNTHWTQQGVISVGNNPRWMVLNKAESKAYIANQNTNTVSVVDAATHLVINTIIVGKSPCGIAIKE